MWNALKERMTLVLALAGMALSILALAAIFIVSRLYSVPSTSSAFTMQWPFIAIIAVVFLLSTLSLMSVIFREINVSDQRQALGLPAGSVRAIIAVGLVVIFIIFVTFLYYDQASSPSRSLPDLTREQYNSIPPEQILSCYTETTSEGETVYQVILKPPEKSAASQDLAKQVVTLLGTLMAAVASFYFGAKVGESKETRQTPVIKVASPLPQNNRLSRKKGEKLTIKLKVTPPGENIDWEAPEDDTDGTLVQVKPGEFEYTRGSQPKDKVFLKFSLVNFPDVTTEFIVVAEGEESAGSEQDKNNKPDNGGKQDSPAGPGDEKATGSGDKSGNKKESKPRKRKRGE